MRRALAEKSFFWTSAEASLRTMAICSEPLHLGPWPMWSLQSEP